MLTGPSLVQTDPHPRINGRAGAKEQEFRRPIEVLYQEEKWRRLEGNVTPATGEITISRWVDLQNSGRTEETITPSDQYVVGIALLPTRIRLATERQIIFDGVMRAGALHVSCPCRQLSAHFDSPFDFLHLHVAADYFQAHRAEAQLNSTRGLDDLLILRDSLSEQLGRTLIEHGTIRDRTLDRCIGEILAIRIARYKPPQVKVNALPKWRLKRVEEYISEHLDRNVGLADLAGVAGLSRMHFAAQFRAATGYRPCEYLQHRRVEHAKSILSDTNMPLVQVALAVGFCTQAHFSTVFKRITGETPARWRSGRNAEIRVV
jgi:AraC-like DNA-binding protein